MVSYALIWTIRKVMSVLTKRYFSFHVLSNSKFRKTWIRFSNNYSPLDIFSEKAMASNSSILLPGKSHGWRSLVDFSEWGRWVGHDWATSLSLFTFMHWRRKWQPTPAFLPGKSQGRGSLVGCCLWGRTESDTTEITSSQQQQIFSTS